MGKLVYYPTTNTICGDTGGGGGGAVDSVNGITGAVLIDVDPPLTIRKEANKVIIGINSVPGSGIATINGVAPDASKDFKLTAKDPSKIAPTANGLELTAEINVLTDSGTATSVDGLIKDLGNAAQGVSTSSPA